MNKSPLDLDQVELHDGLLRRMTVDYSGKSITIYVDLYEHEDDQR